jgi:hypothetical protein
VRSASLPGDRRRERPDRRIAAKRRQGGPDSQQYVLDELAAERRIGFVPEREMLDQSPAGRADVGKELLL